MPLALFTPWLTTIPCHASMHPPCDVHKTALAGELTHRRMVLCLPLLACRKGALTARHAHAQPNVSRLVNIQHNHHVHSQQSITIQLIHNNVRCPDVATPLISHRNVSQVHRRGCDWGNGVWCLQAGIEKLHIKGRIRVTFDPLVDRLPVIGAVKVTAVFPTPKLSSSAHPVHFCNTCEQHK